jgi:hypothetical protein
MPSDDRPGRAVRPDARVVPHPPKDALRVEPRQSSIWIRVDGAWKAGHIGKWIRHGGIWACWLCYQADPEHPDVAPVWNLYAYDPRTIVNRTEHPTPPP